MKPSYILGRNWQADAVFWCLYTAFWHFLFAPEPFALLNLAFSLILMVWQMTASYLHIGQLLPRRWASRISILGYVLSLAIILAAAVLLTWLSLLLVFYNVKNGSGFADSLYYNFWVYWSGALVGGLTSAIAVTTGIYLFARRREQEQKREQLEHARTTAELLYLRGQLNPHFLFNALNSIYFLIPKEPRKAAEALAGFSELLRYQLYRSEASLVPLSEELEQLQRFADLSRLRLEGDFQYQLDLATYPETVKIPSMLLLPLLENAFKYSSKQSGWIKGDLRIQEGRLQFELTNNIDPLSPSPEPEPADKAGGIGLSNIKRRLSLLYPDQYSVTTQKEAATYHVRLEIPLA
ncbi:MAG: histidine kinase [Bacteroidota bacterium]